MKHLLLFALLLLSLCFINTLNAQSLGTDLLLDEQDDEGVVQFSINATGLLSNVLGGNNANFNFIDRHGNLFMVKAGNGRTFFRSGFNLGFDETQDSQFGQNTRQHAYRAVLGIESQRPVGGNFDWLMGYSFYGNYQSTRVTSDDPFVGFTKLVSEDFDLGIEFMLGIQYAISNRVRVFTESYFLAAATRNITRSEFASDPEFNQEVVDKGSNFRLVAPTSIYLAISF